MSKSELIVPEYNTVETLIRSAQVILIVVAVILTISAITLLILYMDIAVSIYSISARYMVYLPLPALISIPFLVISVIISIVATIGLSRIVDRMRNCIANTDVVGFEFARRDLLIWCVLTLIFSLFVPGIILLIAYLKGENVTREIAKLREGPYTQS